MTQRVLTSPTLIQGRQAPPGRRLLPGDPHTAPCPRCGARAYPCAHHHQQPCPCHRPAVVVHGRPQEHIRALTRRLAPSYRRQWYRSLPQDDAEGEESGLEAPLLNLLILIPAVPGRDFFFYACCRRMFSFRPIQRQGTKGGAKDWVRVSRRYVDFKTFSLLEEVDPFLGV